MLFILLSRSTPSIMANWPVATGATGDRDRIKKLVAENGLLPYWAGAYYDHSIFFVIRRNFVRNGLFFFRFIC